jgi:hypothetical protein
MKEEPDSIPAASPRLPRSTSPWSPGRSSKPTQEFPTRNQLGRTALGPHPPDSSRSSLERRKRRFLAYSFPSRSPDPHHLAVLARSDFVGAACHPHRHHPDWAAPSFTVLLRQDRQRRSHTSPRIHSASRRTRRHLNFGPLAGSRLRRRVFMCPHPRQRDDLRGGSRYRFGSIKTIVSLMFSRCDLSRHPLYVVPGPLKGGIDSTSLTMGEARVDERPQRFVERKAPRPFPGGHRI